MEGMTFAEAVKALAGGPLPRPRQPLQVGSTNTAPGPHCTHPDTLRAREIWRSAAPAPGTIVEVYLHDRGITVQPPPSLRFVPRFNFRNGLIFPAMIAAIQSPNGDIIALQATALGADGRGKADLPKDKQRHTLGPLGAGAVRLAAAGLALGIAEGVEDALAALQLTETPCWACLGSGRMHSVCIPTQVRALHIFADDDKAGHEAADRTSKAQRHRTVIVRLPPEGFKDWGAVAQEGDAA
jgi:DNA primase